MLVVGGARELLLVGVGADDGVAKTLVCAGAEVDGGAPKILDGGGVDVGDGAAKMLVAGAEPLVAELVADDGGAPKMFEVVVGLDPPAEDVDVKELLAPKILDDPLGARLAKMDGVDVLAFGGSVGDGERVLSRPFVEPVSGVNDPALKGEPVLEPPRTEEASSLASLAKDLASSLSSSAWTWRIG